MEIISRKEAKASGAKYYFTGKPCKRGHVDLRHTAKSECRECRLEWVRNGTRKYRSKYPERIRAYTYLTRDKAAERSRKHRALKPEKYRAASLRFYYKNKEKRIAANRAWKLANPERWRELQVAWKLNNIDRWRELQRIGQANRRAREMMAEGCIEKSDIDELYHLQAGLCAASDCRVSLSKGYHVDHIVPISRQGSNKMDNLQLLCAFCNLSKHDKTMEEWMAWKAILRSEACH